MLRANIDRVHELRGQGDREAYLAAIADLVQDDQAARALELAPTLLQARFVHQACVEKVEREPWLVHEYIAVFT